MNLLALETSTRHYSVAILKNNKIAAAKSFTLKKVLSSSMIPPIRDVLKKAKISLKELDALAVGLGPGSFTSLRVGLATVKGLAFAPGKKIIGISSLDVLAMGVASTHLQICTIRDAKRNLFYCCFYTKKNGQLKRTTDHMLVGAEQLVTLIKENTFFVGDGIPLINEKIPHDRRGQFLFAPEKFWHPKASYLAFLAQERFQKKKFDSPERIIPLYLYPDDCQVNSHEKKS